MREDKNLNKDCTEGNQQYILDKGYGRKRPANTNTRTLRGMGEREWEWVKESGWYDGDGSVTLKSMLLYVNLSVCGSRSVSHSPSTSSQKNSILFHFRTTNALAEYEHISLSHAILS